MSTAALFDKTAKPALKLADRVQTGGARNPPRCMLYGREGIGKTWFGVHAPRPLVLCTERGTGEVTCDKLKPSTWPEALSDLRALIAEESAYQTLVVDSIDWLESLMIVYVCGRDYAPGRNKLMVDGRPNLDGYGYGKHTGVLLEEWKLFVALVEELQAKRGMNVILLAHEIVVKEKNPEGNDYGCIAPAIHKDGREYLIQWVDALLYAEYEKLTVDGQYGNDDAKRSKIILTAKRIVHTEPRGFRAKNRYSLPPTIELSWRALAAWIQTNDPAVADALRAEIHGLLAADESLADTYHRWMTGVGNNVPALRAGLADLRALVESGPLVKQLEALLPSVKDADKVRKVREWLPANGANVAGLREVIAKLSV